MNENDKNVLIIKYGEIALRGKNRGIHEHMLITSIRKRLDDLGKCWIEKEQGRFILQAEEEGFPLDAAAERIAKIFGVVGVGFGVKTEDQSIENLQNLALEHMQEHYSEGRHTFKVDAVRANKKYPMTSPEIGAEIGGFLLDNMDNLEVDVRKPEVRLKVELRNSAYIYSGVLKGLGGLPSGSAGRAVLLLSGGLDSPVAGYMMAKRGVDITAIYFHSPPYTSERAKEKVKDLAAVIAQYSGNLRLAVVPFTDIQLKLTDSVPPEKITIFLKRTMLKTAERLAEKENALALVTGDSVGQVASQTLQSLRAVNSAVAKLPIIRPLACLDKQEITERAQQIGTYDISILPYDDCCTLFLPQYPETKPKASIIESIEGKLGWLDEEINKAVEEIEYYEF